ACRLRAASRPRRPAGHHGLARRRGIRGRSAAAAAASGGFRCDRARRQRRRHRGIREGTEGESARRAGRGGPRTGSASGTHRGRRSSGGAPGCGREPEGPRRTVPRRRSRRRRRPRGGCFRPTARSLPRHGSRGRGEGPPGRAVRPPRSDGSPRHRGAHPPHEPALLSMIYLDHAATTPLRDEVRDAWLEAQGIGNASSVHGAGQRARRVLEEARERVAARLGCQPIEVVFTSGGTESVNLALKGLWSARPEGRDTIVLPDGEHHASLDAVSWLASREGAAVRAVPLSSRGRIEADAFRAALDGSSALATALVAANETGTINDAAALSAAAADAGVPLHLDAVAAAGHLALDFDGLRGSAPAKAGLVALSISGHKLGAPVGT